MSASGIDRLAGAVGVIQFVLVLVAVFVLAWLIGQTVGGADSPAGQRGSEHSHARSVDPMRMSAGMTLARGW